MEKLLVLVLISTCNALNQNLSGKMLTFPQETDSANVRLKTPREKFSAVTICLRFFTDLGRNHVLFSAATPGNAAFIIKKTAASEIQQVSKNSTAIFEGQAFTLNTWHSLCSTWDSKTGLGQLWMDGKPSARKFLHYGAIRTPRILLGQEQDDFNEQEDQQQAFNQQKSFVGMVNDVHMWDSVLRPCQIQNYTNQMNFAPGNVLSWGALHFQMTGRVVLEDMQSDCKQ
ncbi:hypothetical protein UPYG_G00329810 [Umbra pygmaea]|uniref:Pentraxin family member n=1 Tax=Umbra pygmaea TaxID=75934 RepID=A0ABD0W2K4_UMBPY